MKTLFLSLTLALISLAAVAQVNNPDSISEKKHFVGINGLAIGFDLEYKEEPKGANIQPYTSLYFGYKLSNKLRIQAGVWYGMVLIIGILGLSM
ncbi:hypothetical protein [Pontibacter populi]|uniref:Outer membrane protein beta-barrel domain-containing protein n=1 Tax=Pontibacter populi TaxID=890055 RepID=A0ABV1RSL3_9BACT